MLALAPSWELVTVVMVVLGFGFTGAHAVLQARATEIVPRARGTAIAGFACALFMGGSVGTALLGVAIGLVGYQSVLFGLAVAIAVFTVLGWRGVRIVANQI